MKYYIAALLAVFSLEVDAQTNRKICISIDDLPTVEYGVPEENHGWKITYGILKACEKHDAQAIGYVNPSKFLNGGAVDEQKLEYLKEWLKAGMELGNHTFSHMNYHKVSFQDFTKDVLDGEKVVKELVESHGEEYRFFRHPYLRSGRDSIETKRLKDFLVKNGYQEAFVTVDDDDYLFALAYARAYRRSDTKLMSKIGDAYLSYMIEKLKYFETRSIELFGRNINHTLLIHASLLNATYLDQILSAYESMGYAFISQGDAISDPAYETPVTKYGDWGVSWIDKWALSAGKKDAFFSEDPKVPEFVLDLSK